MKPDQHHHFPLAASMMQSLFFLGISASLLAAEEMPNLCGYVVTRDGKTITFTRVSESSKYFGFRYGPEDKATRIPLANVRQVRFGEKGKSAVIQLKDGREIDAKYSTTGRYGDPCWPSLSLSLFYFDDVAGKESNSSCAFKIMSQLVIDEPVGRFRRCPHCKATWPDAFLFCPHDGARTAWGERAGSLTLGRRASAPVSDEDARKRKASLLEAVLNASLARSGVDPSSKEAQQAKEFGKLWMNPLSDPKDIQKKLDELREEWRKKAGGQ